MGLEVYIIGIRKIREEELGYYWHKSAYGFEQIESLLEDTVDYYDEECEYTVVPYDVISPYINRRPIIEDEEEEIIAYLYG